MKVATLWRLGVLAATLPTSGADLGHLRVEVVDAYGMPIREGIRATLLHEMQVVREAHGSSPLVFPNLRVGRYLLTIHCVGARPVFKVLIVPPGEYTTRVGLVLATTGDPEPRGITISGEARPCRADQALWVKLVGVYADEVAVARVSESCRFRFFGLSGGYYVALLLDGGSIREAKVVRVDWRSTEIIFGEKTVEQDK